MRVKTSLLILIMVILGPMGNVLLRRGMLTAATVPQVLSSATIWLGIACLLTYVLAEMVVLSWADYSYVQPVAASAYGVVAVLGYVVLGEDVSPLRWLGVLVICLGVFIVGRTSPGTTRTKRA